MVVLSVLTLLVRPVLAADLTALTAYKESDTGYVSARKRPSAQLDSTEVRRQLPSPPQKRQI
jgi:hypothetical protein